MNAIGAITNNRLNKPTYDHSIIKPHGTNEIAITIPIVFNKFFQFITLLLNYSTLNLSLCKNPI